MSNENKRNEHINKYYQFQDEREATIPEEDDWYTRKDELSLGKRTFWNLAFFS